MELVIIVAAHNEEQTIAECLEGLQGFHCIVVANGCTDETATIARAYNAEVIETPALLGKKAEALNIGWARACELQPDYVLTLDADTVATAQSVNLLIQDLQQDPELVAVCARYQAKDSSNFIQDLATLEYYRQDDDRKLKGGKVLVASGAASMYRQTALLELGCKPWDECSLIEDYTLTLALRPLGKIRSSANSMVLTAVPDSAKALWRQRARWTYGGVQELLKAGLNRHTYKDWLSYGLFFLGITLRLLWIYLIIYLILYSSLTWSLLAMLPIFIVWVDRLTSLRTSDRLSRRQGLIAGTMLVEDLYGLVKEFHATVCVVKALIGRKKVSW